MIASSLLQLPDWNNLAQRSLAGELLTREEARAVLNAPDDILLDQLAAAYRVRRHYWGNRVRLHFLLNAQSGLCPEDCHYCSQSKISSADIEKYPLLATEKILAAADRAAQLKAGTFCFVISGRSPKKITPASRWSWNRRPSTWPARSRCSAKASIPPVTKAFTTARPNHAKFSMSAAGAMWRPCSSETPCTAPTNTCARSPWKFATASTSTLWWAT